MSLCLVTKDRNVDLPEWVLYHLLAGVDHFFIYDNDSKIPVTETLAPEIKSGYVTVIPLHGGMPQPRAYKACLSDFREASFWIGFLDDDEFAVRRDDLSELKSLLREYESYPGVAANWLVFGSSGHISRPKGLVVENYLRRAETWYDLNRYVKWFVQPQRTLESVNACVMKFANDEVGVNEKRDPVKISMSRHTTEKIAVHHYYFKSREEWDAKAARPRSRGGKLAVNAFNDHDKNCNKVEDKTLLKFKPEIESLLRNRLQVKV